MEETDYLGLEGGRMRQTRLWIQALFPSSAVSSTRSGACSAGRCTPHFGRGNSTIRRFVGISRYQSEFSAPGCSSRTHFLGGQGSIDGFIEETHRTSAFRPGHPPYLPFDNFGGEGFS